MKRHAMSEMPKSDEDVSKWCKDIFVAKVLNYITLFLDVFWLDLVLKIKRSIYGLINYFWSKYYLPGFSFQDALLDKHLATGTFDEEIRPIGRPVKSLLVKPHYSCMLYILQWHVTASLAVAPSQSIDGYCLGWIRISWSCCHVKLVFLCKSC